MLGALIGAGATLLGGKLAGDRAEKLNKSAIQSRVADAEKAGVSKLYALGANVPTYSPASMVGQTAISDAGQNIGRAIDAKSTAVERAGGVAGQLAQAQLEGVRIDNDIKRQELLSKTNVRNQPGQPPAINDAETMPLIAGQGNAGIKIQKQISPAGSQPQKSFGVSPEVDMWRTKHGFAPEVPQELGEAHESQPLAAAQWFIRNKIMPSISEGYKTFPYQAPEGYHWKFNPVFGEYVLTKGKGQSRMWNDMMDKLRR